MALLRASELRNVNYFGREVWLTQSFLEAAQNLHVAFAI
jgi:hypothetical protein